jgi:hypothetical protein
MDNLDKIKQLRHESYIGIITEINRDYVKAKFEPDNIELDLPRQVLASIMLFRIGDGFKYIPNERNKLNIFNIDDFRWIS